MQSEVIALLFPAPSSSADGSTPLVTALLRDAEGLMELRHLRPDKALLRKARVAGRHRLTISVTGAPLDVAL